MIFKSFIRGNVIGLKLYKSSRRNINEEIGYTLSSIIEKKHQHPSCKWTYLNKTYELNRACINNIFINKEFRNKYYGSFILDKTEKLLQKEYHINYIKLLAWEKYNDDLIYFYKKNGYSEMCLGSINKYDDGENIYDLTPMDKYLTIR
tara:strand:+ start:109 stop:552 length:444 start_codon:yes stop_codon:yes gene_type:complete